MDIQTQTHTHTDIKTKVLKCEQTVQKMDTLQMSETIVKNCTFNREIPRCGKWYSFLCSHFRFLFEKKSSPKIHGTTRTIKIYEDEFIWGKVHK